MKKCNQMQKNDSSDTIPQACVFVLFGATGDLAARKIAPALYNQMKEGLNLIVSHLLLR